mgnify:CR=1 FL=1
MSHAPKSKSTAPDDSATQATEGESGVRVKRGAWQNPRQSRSASNVAKDSEEGERQAPRRSTRRPDERPAGARAEIAERALAQRQKHVEAPRDAEPDADSASAKAESGGEMPLKQEDARSRADSKFHFNIFTQSRKGRNPYADLRADIARIQGTSPLYMAALRHGVETSDMEETVRHLANTVSLASDRLLEQHYPEQQDNPASIGVLQKQVARVLAEAWGGESLADPQRQTHYADRIQSIFSGVQAASISFPEPEYDSRMAPAVQDHLAEVSAGAYIYPVLMRVQKDLGANKEPLLCGPGRSTSDVQIDLQEHLYNSTKALTASFLRKHEMSPGQDYGQDLDYDSQCSIIYRSLLSERASLMRSSLENAYQQGKQWIRWAQGDRARRREYLDRFYHNCPEGFLVQQALSQYNTAFPESRIIEENPKETQDWQSWVTGTHREEADEQNDEEGNGFQPS